MSDFIIQKDTDVLNLESIIIKELLDKNKYIYTYNELSLSSLNLLESPKPNLYPIGTIEFVTYYLNKVYGIKQMNPIEIPEYLRTEEFLKRDYKIVNAEEIPENGTYFVKDISQLKVFGTVIYLDKDIKKDLLSEHKSDMDFSLNLDKTHLYQVSEVYDIQAEYRVYVIDGNIEAICNYNGDCTVLPDIGLLKKAVNLINFNEKWLKSYTLDIMVGSRGTAIIEVHNFVSVGLYSTLWGNNLIYAYKDGIDYVINDNKEMKLK